MSKSTFVRIVRSRTLPYVAGGLVLASTTLAGAESIAPYTATDLDGTSAIVKAFLAVGATIVLGMVLYKVGRRAANKVG